MTETPCIAAWIGTMRRIVGIRACTTSIIAPAGRITTINRSPGNVSRFHALVFLHWWSVKIPQFD